MHKKEINNLQVWYKQNYRPLPWRKHKQPYPIWISETMLQQTTSVGVLPYYEKFLAKFPNLKSLAQAEEKDVLELWAGLGYYSRARNLHKCAKELYSLPEFPRTWSELIKMPGIGPYTSRAISSLSFDEAVGVIDGNVIRILSRFYHLPIEWWKPAGRHQLQTLADKIAQQGPPAILNQALMELGATICRPKNPHCQLCPIAKSCQTFSKKTKILLPLKKPKKKTEIWLWEPQLIEKNQNWALIKNLELPFLRNQWIFPGMGKRLNTPPNNFDFKHFITHHEIYVKISKKKNPSLPNRDWEWISNTELPKVNPSSLIKKTIEKGHIKNRYEN